MRICAIHQPNFFPWLGYFDKINRADVFVFLDKVDYPKSSKTMASYGNRVAVLVQGRSCWVSCPVIREPGRQKICDIYINEQINWRGKLIKTLELNYKKSKYFKEVWPFLKELIYYRTDKISDYNSFVIKAICEKLKIESSFVRQTDLNTAKASTELLIEIIKQLQCDTYICGSGAAAYQEDFLFREHEIELIYQNFIHPVYNQANECGFEKGLSVLDALFWCGYEGTNALLNGCIDNSLDYRSKR